MSQSGTNTVIDFGGGNKIMLQGVTDTNLTAGNFLFAPVAAFALTQDGNVHGGQTVQLSLAVSGVVSVNTSGDLPTLTLSNGAIATYDALAGINVGTVGSNLSIVGCANLLGNGMTQTVMQQNNGNFWLYSYNAASNSLSGTLVGAIGSNFHVVGFGPLGTAGRDEMLMQDAAGNFEVYQYNASLNAFVGNAMGAVGAPWVVDGIAADPPTASMGSSDSSSAQLVQAMAGFGGDSATAPLNAAPLGADTSQQSFLTTPQQA